MVAQERGRPDGTTREPRDVDERLRRVLDRLASRRAIGHAVLGVRRGDASFEWFGAAGVADADGTPMEPETPFFIASVTKLFIAAQVLHLHERGDVALDAPMGTYLPDELIAGLHRIDGVDHTPRITVRHLLSHTSGLPDYLEDRPTGGRSLYRELAEGADGAWTLEDVVGITRDELRPHFPPRDLAATRVKARYSDTNFQLLIAIIEAVTGRALHRVLEDRFFRPLRLRHTWLPGHSEPLEPAGKAAAVWSKGRPLDMPLAMGSFRDLASTAEDTLRFLRALVRGEVFDDPGTSALMQERWNRIFFPMRHGLGMMRFPIGRLLAPGRRPVTLVGHSGGTGFWLFHCPELDLLMTGTVDEVNARAGSLPVLPEGPPGDRRATAGLTGRPGRT